MQNRRIILLIMLGLTAWAIFLAVGAYSLNRNPLRPVAVLACCGAFLGFWALMLQVRARSVAKKSAEPTDGAPRDDARGDHP